MRVALLTHFGSPSVLQIRKRPDLGAPGPGKMLVSVEAIGVSLPEVILRMGLEPVAPTLPMVPGHEVCGIVRAIGDGVRGVAVGDRVCGLVPEGGYAEQCQLQAATSFRVPDHTTALEAAAIPHDYVLAWLALFSQARLRPGEEILVIGADEGLGRAVVDLAAKAGARVYAVAGDREDLLSLGAVDCFLSEEAIEGVRAFTEGRGLATIVDTVGGESTRELRSLLSPLGRTLYLGFRCLLDRHRSYLRALYRTATMPRHGALGLWEDCHAVMGLSLDPLWERPALFSPAVSALREMLESGSLRIKLDRSFPLDEVAAAHGRFQDRVNRGKIVLSISAEG